MATTSERIEEWLRDAHAAEAQAATMLRGTAGRNDDYPEFSQLLTRQADLCDNHARALDQCLADRGASPSLFKDAAGQATALGQSLSGLVVGDEVVKAALSTATFARMLVNSGRVLAAAASAEGRDEIAEVCRGMADENESFARELEEMLPLLTAQYLARETGLEDTSSDPATEGNHPRAPAVG